MSGEQRTTPRAAGFALSIASVVLVLGLAEVGLRVAGIPELHPLHTFPTQFHFLADRGDGKVRYVNQPSSRIRFVYGSNPRGYFGSENQVDHPTNRLGFRGPDWRLGPEGERVVRNDLPGRLRIAFLGDSFTFGEGVWFEDTYPERTAALLEERGRRVEALNLGVGGYNTSQALDLLDTLVLPAQPDAVVLGYVLNDAEPALFAVDPETGRQRRVPRPIEEWVDLNPPSGWMQRSRLVQLVWKLRADRVKTRQVVDYYRSLYHEGSPGWRESREALIAFVERCRARRIPCLVVLFPMLHGLDASYPYRDAHAMVRETARQAGATVVDLLPLLEGLDPRELWVYPSDQHPNERVHQIAARAVSEALEDAL